LPEPATRFRLATTLAVLTLAGCGGGEETKTGTQPPPPSTGTADLEPGAVAVADFLFDPKEAKVQEGAKVTWVNTGATIHTVKGKGFFSKDIKPGGIYERRFAKAGRYRYVCTLHPQMAGTVVVG
jgi:plastocyanin